MGRRRGGVGGIGGHEMSGEVRKCEVCEREPALWGVCVLSNISSTAVHRIGQGMKGNGGIGQEGGVNWEMNWQGVEGW